MKQITRLLFLILPLMMFSQTITVVDVETDKPLADVLVTSISTKKTLKTDSQGKINLKLDESENWYEFSLVGYEKALLTIEEIKSLEYIVYLDYIKESLKEIIVSNTKWDEDRKFIPRQFIKTTKTEIFFSNPQTSADLLQKTGHVFIQKSQLGGGSPFIRGFSANRLLLTVDGVRMNNAIFRGGNLQNVISIDPLSVQNAEVILGPASVVYGSDAIGGAVNFETLQPTLQSKNTSALSGNILYRYSTANSEQTIHTDVNLSSKKWASLTGFTFSSFQDLIQGSNGPDDYLRSEFVKRINNSDVVIQNQNSKEQIPSGYDQYNFIQKVLYKPNSKWDIGLNFIYTTTSDYDRYDRLLRKSDGQFSNAEWFYGPQRWLMASNKIKYEKPHLLFDKLSVISAYQFFEESRNTRDFESEIRNTNTENVYAHTLNIDAKKNYDITTINYGFEYLTNTVLSKAIQTNIITNNTVSQAETRYPDDSKWRSIAAYLLAKTKLTKCWGLQGGIRYNHIYLKALFEDSTLGFPFDEAKINTGALTGSLGSTLQISKKLIAKANFNTAFRAPNIDDIGKIYSDSKPGALVVPNPDLKPEYAYNSEIGLSYNNEKITVSAASYYTFLDNALTRDNFTLNGNEKVNFRGELSEVFAIQNSNSQYIYGFEFDAQFLLFPKLYFNGNYTITKGEETLSTKEKVAVRHVSPNFGRLSLSYQKTKWQIEAYTEFNEGFSFEELAPSEKDKIFIYAKNESGNPFQPSWYTINLRGSKILSKSFTFTATLENITDQRYRPYSSGISAPGINFVSSLKYSF